ncbi:RagB/SusD family nutrient uptake outer membrane protein [Mucilaginibacter terrae]|uniref:RagB/SusD family nutrient uptake outer membrane protein n=1 Tax=Mucilaginibacter terrae TaxID=1955052 RepID=UPI003626B18D
MFNIQISKHHISLKVALIICSGVILFSSCKKFLNEEPVTGFSPTVAFSNSVQARNTVLGVYNQLAGDFGFGNRLSTMYPYDTDEMISGANINTPDNASRDLARYAITADNSVINTPFTQLYRGIDRANVCIKSIPLMAQYNGGGEQAEVRRLHGEALTLRAIFFTELIKHWGDVPAPFEPSTDREDQNLPKVDRDTIYDRLLKDLELASTLVPWRGDPGVTEDERITKGAVKALRARIALFRGGYSLRRSKQMERPANYKDFYEIARKECAEIMMRPDKHTLNPSFQAVFKDNILAHKIEPNGEVMMEVAMAGINAASDSRLGAWNGPRINGNGNLRIFLLPTYFYAFNQLDTRRDVTAAPYSISATGFRVGATLAAMPDGKFRRDWITPAIPINEGGSYFGVNWPIIRFSDVLLMFAEAQNEIGGPTAEAINAVNTVRRRSWARGVKTITITNGGAGYTSAPTLTFTGGGGSGATAVATVTSGVVTAINIIETGNNYTGNPTVVFTGGGATAAATATTTVSSVAEADLTPAQVASPVAFLQAIQNERLLEFGSEGIRKYDLIRWNLLYTKILEARQNLTLLGARLAPYTYVPQYVFFRTNAIDLVAANSYYAPSPAATTITGFTRLNWAVSIGATLINKVAGDFVPNKSELYPIPQTSLESNRNLKQDYGY